jgi:hypothetical protein
MSGFSFTPANLKITPKGEFLLLKCVLEKSTELYQKLTASNLITFNVSYAVPKRVPKYEQQLLQLLLGSFAARITLFQ